MCNGRTSRPSHRPVFPTVLAREVRAAILDYLATTLSIADPGVEAELVRFLDGPDGMFRGPFVDLRLPFRRGAGEVGELLDVAPPFPPYAHQRRAFERLSSKRDRPRHTLVTTGTGSGKTECFLYPVLDHCAREVAAGRRGIKAIVLYPMNALASDQARRLAKELATNAKLTGVRAGLYVGGKGTHADSGPEHLADKREALRKDPPDVLLTNYRMLDFLLLRPEDRTLWERNEPDTLRYLVLDELHTYDGAQGSDVACLVRRLKQRLRVPRGSLCCVGTSATVGDGDSASRRALEEFASTIFGEAFDKDAIVGEDRLTLEEALGDAVDAVALPADAPLEALRPDAFDGHEAWLAKQREVWFGARASALTDPRALAAALARHPVLRGVIAALDGVTARDEVDGRLVECVDGWAGIDAERRAALLDSLLGLVAAARDPDGPDGVEASKLRPFLQLQVQSWVRELRRLMWIVGDAPRFVWAEAAPGQVSPGNDGMGIAGGGRSGGAIGAAIAAAPGAEAIDADTESRALPIAHCRECGAMGWATARRVGTNTLVSDPAEVGKAWLERSPEALFLLPTSAEAEAAADAADDDDLRAECRAIDPHRLVLLDPKPETVAAGAPLVLVGDDLTENNPPRFRGRCPDCGTDRSLSILGSRAASLLSIAVGQLYRSRFNDDDKLLAFTDSVQDASHRAGFFGARTFRFDLRIAIQAALEERFEAGEEPSLAGCERLVLDHARRHEAREGRAIVDLLPSDLRELREYEAFLAQEGRGAHPELERILLERLSWELCLEFGHNSRVGRTLERTGCAIARVDEEALERAAEALTLDLHERRPFARIGGEDEAAAAVADIDRDTVRYLLLGLVQRLRTSGGVEHPVLRRYVEENGNRFFLTRRKNPFIAPFGRHSRLPRWVTDRSPRANQVFDVLPGSTRRLNWYRDFAARVFGVEAMDPGLVEFYRQAMQRLEEAGVVLRTELRAAGGGTAWGLRRDALRLTGEVVDLACPVCRRSHGVAAGEVDHWLDRPCPRYRCAGRLERAGERDARVGEQAYYRRLFASGHLARVHAAEHTGLLERGDREALEERFKRGDALDAPNLFVCTPTLEMGIDVGDLSAVYLCSVPPTTANFLQRVGRAGRTTGNAFALTLGLGRPHDLYFLAEPREMMAGEVLPPGCLLDSKAMLERQLVAHAMDAWARQTSGDEKIRGRVNLILNDLEGAAFPGGFLSFYRERKEELTEAFLSSFGEVTSDRTRLEVRRFGQGDGVERAVLDAFERLKTEREELKRLRDKAKRELDALDERGDTSKEAEAEREELDDARRAFHRLYEELGTKYPLNVLTDEGVLPNYAFPEAGVTLRSIVRGEARDASGKPVYEPHEYVRPASTAIRELAPMSTFYAEGRHVVIDEVDVGTPARSLLERWRLCPQCHHTERVGEDEGDGGVSGGRSGRGSNGGPADDDTEVAGDDGAAALGGCPRCGADGWADQGQVRTMLHFRRSRSVSSKLHSVTTDDSDDRDEVWYETRPFVDVEPSQCQGARANEHLPFGYEFVSELTLREVNFGTSNEGRGRGFETQGEEIKAAGFEVCRECGRVKVDEQGGVQHAGYCSARKEANREQLERVFLFRELRSEAIRLLLPIAALDAERRQASFRAALALGLRRWFQGRPLHLMVRDVEEPTGDGHRRRFLVLLDTVPGGTGYLSSLVEEGKLFEVLERAKDALEGCPRCREHELDGCYRCLFAFESQRDLPHLSSRVAREMIEEILAARDGLESVRTLSDVRLDERLDSELERLFLDRLHKVARGRHGWGALEEDNDRGKAVWRLRAGERRWIVEPQVDLGPEHGVDIPCRPDFVLRPEDGEPGVREVALFCDGAAYHVQAGQPKGRVSDDLRKREALRASGRFVAWSLTWHDVLEIGAGPRGTCEPWLGRASTDRIHAFWKQWSVGPDRELLGSGAGDALLDYLADPRPDRWRSFSLAAAAAWASSGPGIDAGRADELEGWLQDEPRRPVDDLGPARGGATYDRVLQDGAGVLLVRLAQGGSTEAVLAASSVTLRLFDEAEERAKPEFVAVWRRALHALSLLQFFPGDLSVVTSEERG